MSTLSNAGNEIIVVDAEHGSKQTFYMSKLWHRFELYELTELMTQKDDLKFAEALLRFAKGATTTEDDEMFGSRELSNLNLTGKITIPNATAIAFKNTTGDNITKHAFQKISQKYVIHLLLILFQRHAINLSPKTN